LEREKIKKIKKVLMDFGYEALDFPTP